MSNVMHGGKLDQAMAKYGGSRAKWLDLSTGINPASYPLPDLPKDVWTRLPDQQLTDDCISAARGAYGANEHSYLSLAPGSQMHIQTLPLLFKPQAVAIVGFTYQEHGVSWKRAGHEVYVTDGLGSAEATARIVIVVNPNNPDGRIVDKDEMTALARRLGAKGGLLVVDEAFADASPLASIADQTGRDGLLVMRSLGKFYGLGGVRLGVALTNESLGRRLDAQLGPWAVSGPALAIGAAALGNTKWQNQARKKLSTGREMLEEVLLNSGFDIVGGTNMYVLGQRAEAGALAEHLAAQKILVRTFPGKPEWLRFGLPGKKSDFARLEKAIASFAADR